MRAAVVGWALVALTLVGAGCKPASELTDEQAASRASQGLEDVCPPRGAGQDIFLIDRVFAGSTGQHSSSQGRRNNSFYLRLVVYDGASGKRKKRVTIDRIKVADQNAKPDRASCLGWVGDELWLWSRREGLHARSPSGAIVRTEKQVEAAGLGAPIEQVGYAPAESRVVVETQDGRRWLVGEGLKLEKAPRGVDVVERRRSMGPTLRVGGTVRRGALRAPLRGQRRLGASRDGRRITLQLDGKPIGTELDFKHPVELLLHAPTSTFEWDGPSVVLIEPGLTQKAPRTVHRVGLGGAVDFDLEEPEPCAAPHTCVSAAWQATSDAKRLYFFGRQRLHAYDAATGAELWAGKY